MGRVTRAQRRHTLSYVAYRHKSHHNKAPAGLRTLDSAFVSAAVPPKTVAASSHATVGIVAGDGHMTQGLVVRTENTKPSATWEVTTVVILIFPSL